MTRIFVIIIILAAFGADDRDKGRKGNKRYDDRKYQEAARLYREGIAALNKSTEPAVRTGLFNNLGAALNRLESFDESAASFTRAIETAESEHDLSRASYNAGNTAFQAQDPQGALDYYRNALLADPENADARYNYEFVKRSMESQKQSSDSGDKQQQQQDQDQDQEQDQEQQQSEDEQPPDQKENQERRQEPDDEPQEQNPDQEEPEQREEMTEEQAEQILEALQNDEQELLRQVWRMKGKPRSVEKDW